MSDSKAKVTTEDNPPYNGLSAHGRPGETKNEHEYIQSSSAAAPQEAVL